MIIAWSQKREGQEKLHPLHSLCRVTFLKGVDDEHATSLYVVRSHGYDGSVPRVHEVLDVVLPTSQKEHGKMNTFTAKLKRLPLTVKVLLVVLAVDLIVFSIYMPWWPIFLYNLAFLEAYCPNVDWLGGGCRAENIEYLYSWTRLLNAIVGIILTLILLHKWWKKV